MIVVLIIFVLLLSAALGVSLRLNYRLGKQLLMLEDQVEESLDLLDKYYKSISKAAETPVLYDEPVIKGVVKDIYLAKKAVLLVANKLVAFGSTENTLD